MLNAEPAAVSIAEAIARFLKIERLRTGQRAAVEALTSGRDTVVIMPTGGGKSLVYQTVALLLPGTALVVSPLIALMHDQLAALQECNYPGVAMLHSQVPESEQRTTLAALGDGSLRLLYVTPERCASPAFIQVARQTRISLIAVDEAHCISEWGHDFRPEYQLIDDAARALGRPPIAALTATATPDVRSEIVERLGLHDPAIVVRGFDRPNLFYEVYGAENERDKQELVRRLVADCQAEYAEPLATRISEAGNGRGIVYTALTKSARTISQRLNKAGVHAAYYHGQLKAGQRNAVQEYFRDGSVRAIAATNAFGMGVDLPDMRFVLHYDSPASLEAYYQESGRAGRDGELARCALLFVPEDLGRAAFAGGSGAIPEEELRRVAAILEQAPKAGVTRAQLAEQAGLPESRAVRNLEVLVATRAITERRGRYTARGTNEEAVTRAARREERRTAQQRTRLEMMRTYAGLTSCRRQFLLQYFGEYDAPAECGMCDRCVPRASGVRIVVPATTTPVDSPESPFRPGEAVLHETLGTGVVQHVAAEKITIHFAQSGYRTLDLGTVVERGLLRPAVGDGSDGVAAR